jgi:hypothetical protein
VVIRNEIVRSRPAARLRYRYGGNLAEIFPYNFSFARAPKKFKKGKGNFCSVPPSILLAERRGYDARGQKFSSPATPPIFARSLEKFFLMR